MRICCQDGWSNSGLDWDPCCCRTSSECRFGSLIPPCSASQNLCHSNSVDSGSIDRCMWPKKKRNSAPLLWKQQIRVYNHRDKHPFVTVSLEMPWWLFIIVSGMIACKVVDLSKSQKTPEAQTSTKLLWAQGLFVVMPRHWMVPCYQMLHPKFSGPEIDSTMAPCSPLGCSRWSQHGKFMDTTYRNLVLQCKDFKYYNNFSKLSTLICSTREPLVLSCLPNAAARSYNNKRRYMKLYEGRDMISSLTSLTNLQPLGQQPRTPDAFYNTSQRTASRGRFTAGAVSREPIAAMGLRVVIITGRYQAKAAKVKAKHGMGWETHSVQTTCPSLNILNIAMPDIARTF